MAANPGAIWCSRDVDDAILLAISADNQADDGKWLVRPTYDR